MSHTSPQEREQWEGSGPDHVITHDQLKLLRRVATRLYSENRLNGDEMRDLAHTLTAICDTCDVLEIPQDV